MANVDLDKARAARAEANGEAPTVTFGGEVFTLPVEMPFGIIERVGDMTKAQEQQDGLELAAILSDISRMLFGERFEEFNALQPSMVDMQVLLDSVVPLYGATPGESAASEG
jgi:hypothetical protein